MENSKYEKSLNKADVFALAFGAMIGWGWVVLSGDWILSAGTLGAVGAFVVGGVMIFFVGHVYAELVAALPKNGGVLVFSKRAFGPTVSFICTWAMMLGYISVIAFEVVALPTVVQYLFPDYLKGYMYTIAGFDVYFSWMIFGVLSSVAIAVINILGVKTAMVLQTTMTFLVFAVGLTFMGGAAANGSAATMQPLFKGMNGVLVVAVMTPFMYVGFEVIPQAAEEMNVPVKKIGQILVISVVSAVIWYAAIILGVGRTMPAIQLAGSGLATADAMANAFHGSSLASKIMILGGIGGIVTTWNSFYVGCSRTICSMADERMLPQAFGKLHPKFKTPCNAIILIFCVTTIAPFFGRTMLVWLSNAGGFGIVVCNLIVTLSFLVLRKKEPDLPRPYKVKGGVTVGVVAMLLSAAMILLYLPGTPAALSWPYEWGITIGWTLIGIALITFSKAHSPE
ncbi:APC family permease [Synergistaceae bacterium OttesenSCG-928-D05]|nr:APC family permease [Synergistaceae bacterium OttesenSCG-928-D05]